MSNPVTTEEKIELIELAVKQAHMTADKLDEITPDDEYPSENLRITYRKLHELIYEALILALGLYKEDKRHVVLLSKIMSAGARATETKIFKACFDPEKADELNHYLMTTKMAELNAAVYEKENDK